MKCHMSDINCNLETQKHSGFFRKNYIACFISRVKSATTATTTTTHKQRRAVVASAVVELLLLHRRFFFHEI